MQLHLSCSRCTKDLLMMMMMTMITTTMTMMMIKRQIVELHVLRIE